MAQRCVDKYCWAHENRHKQNKTDKEPKKVTDIKMKMADHWAKEQTIDG